MTEDMEQKVSQRNTIWYFALGIFAASMVFMVIMITLWVVGINQANAQWKTSQCVAINCSATPSYLCNGESQSSRDAQSPTSLRSVGSFGSLREPQSLSLRDASSPPSEAQSLCSVVSYKFLDINNETIFHFVVETVVLENGQWHVTPDCEALIDYDQVVTCYYKPGKPSETLTTEAPSIASNMQKPAVVFTVLFGAFLGMSLFMAFLGCIFWIMDDSDPTGHSAGS